MAENGGPRVVMLEAGGFGGIHHYAHGLANALADLGTPVTLLTTERFELADRPCRCRCVRVLRREWYPLTLIRLIRLLRRERAVLLHLQSLVSPRKDLVLFLLCRLLGLSLVLTVHNVLPHEIRRGERGIFRWYYRLAQALIVHSEQNRQELLTLEPGLCPSRVRVIPHGNYAGFRDLEPDQRTARHRLGLPETARIALFFGMVRPYKGLDLFLDSVRPVRTACPEAHFVVAGEILHGDRRVYETQCEQLGLGPADLSRRFGYLSMAESIAYVAAADLVVLPYRAISQSGVLLLASTFGRPVLATRVGSFPETIEEGGSGWLVDPGDGPGLTRALGELLARPAVLAAAGARARELADTRYGWPGIARRTTALYAEVLTGEESR